QNSGEFTSLKKICGWFVAKCNTVSDRWGLPRSTASKKAPYTRVPKTRELVGDHVIPCEQT
ncbi:MAG: hypothetical protein ACKOFJ_06365, partial [Actinomycetota bacterium]